MHDLMQPFDVTINIYGRIQTLTIKHEGYYTTLSMHILAILPSGEHYGTLTTYNLASASDTAFVKLYTENENWVPQVVTSNEWVERFEFVRKAAIGPYDAPCEIWRRRTCTN